MLGDSKSLFIDIDNCLQSYQPVYLKNCAGIYLNCNIHWAQNVCLSSVEDIVGKTDKDIFEDSNEVALINKNDQELLKTKTPSVFMENITLKNVQRCSMLTYKMPIKNRAGIIVGIIGTSINIEKNIDNAHLNNLPSAENGQYNDKLNINISKRERQCLYHLVRGMTAKEIARILNLSPRTIEFYIENMKKKFSCVNRIDLIAKAYDILGKN